MTASGSWAAYLDIAEDQTRVDPRGPRRVFDFLLFAMLPMVYVDISGLPASELAMSLAVFIALTRPPLVGWRTHPWLQLLLPLLFLWMIVSANINDVQPYRRLLHIGLFTLLAILLAQGRFSIRSVAPGMATGLLVSAAAFYFGFGADYEGRLTGLMGDPNAAGYLLTVLGCATLAGLPSGQRRNLLAVILLVAVFLTYSRTALLAVLLILAWSIVGRRLSAGLGVLLLAGMIYGVANFPESLQKIGPFGDRTGSDLLRQRIVAQEHVQVALSPWVGNGAGSTSVDVSGQIFFFHNSYLALQSEGGRVAQVLLLLAGTAALLGLVRLAHRQRSLWLEAALIAVAVCATNLGEVLLELPTAVALGMAAYHVRVNTLNATAQIDPGDRR